MRIALFHNVPSGGAKRAVYEWTRRLVPRHQVHAYTLSTADQRFCDIRPWVARHEEAPFVTSPLFSSPFGRLNQLQRWRDLNRLVAAGRVIAARIDRAGCDVVFANTCRFTFVPTVLLFVNCPSVYFLHEPFGKALVGWSRPPAGSLRLRGLLDAIDPMIRLYRRRLDRLQRGSFARPVTFLANSAFTATRMRDAYGVAAAVCPIGVDIEAFHPFPEVARGRHVLSVGELAPRKGFDFLVEALALIPAASRPALRLACNTVVPEERQYVEALARAREVRLDIRTELDTVQLAREYNEAALCVFAPVNEPFGLVPLEAMACGTAVVGVREGGVPESVVHERTGLLAERRPAPFAAAVQALLAAPALLAEFGRNGRAHVAANWGWDRSVLELERQLQQVAAAGAGGGGGRS